MRNKLTAMAVKKSGDGKLQDGAGLYLIKKGDGGRWIYRYQMNRRRREMGLGSLPVVTLAAARQERDRWSAVLASAFGGQPNMLICQETLDLARAHITLNHLMFRCFCGYL